jgi:uncharacterized protein DUF4406
VKVYVAGPYSQGDPVLNVRAAIDVAEVLVALGHTPYVPHLTILWHLVAPHDTDFWYGHDLEWLAACDAVVRLPGPSVGADTEVKEAERLGIPVYTSATDVR